MAAAGTEETEEPWRACYLIQGIGNTDRKSTGRRKREGISEVQCKQPPFLIISAHVLNCWDTLMCSPSSPSTLPSQGNQHPSARERLEIVVSVTVLNSERGGGPRPPGILRRRERAREREKERESASRLLTGVQKETAHSLEVPCPITLYLMSLWDLTKVNQTFQVYKAHKKQHKKSEREFLRD